jgi:hypothetical protein
VYFINPKSSLKTGTGSKGSFKQDVQEVYNIKYELTN